MAEMDDKVIVTKDKITDIADTIRETGGTSARMTLDEMPDNIRAIGEGGGNVVAPLFVKNGNNYTCNLTFAKIEEIYAGTGDTKASMPQLIYSGNDTRSIYCNVEQENEDAFSFDFNIGAIGITNTGYKEKHIVLIMESDNSISFNREYTLEYQEDMIACKISWDSRLNKYICNKTYAQLKDMYVDNPDSSTKLPFLCTRYGHKSNSCNVQYIEEGHLILILFFMGSIPEHIVDDQQLVYMQAIVYENGTITVGEVYKHYSKFFEPYNGIEFAQGTSPRLQLTENVRNSIATSLMIGASSGSVASISDGGANMPLKSCMVAIEPVQSGSGDPSPSNVRAISGWTECNVTRDGENLWDEEWEVGSINAQGEKVAGSGNNIRTKNYTFLKPSTTYYFYCGSASVGREVFFYDINKTFISYQTLNANGTFTTPTNAKYMLFTMYSAYGNTYNNDISINYPSTDTSYHAYQGNTYNIEFVDGSTTLTVYGGSIDFVSGALTVNKKGQILTGNEEFTLNQSGTNTSVFKNTGGFIPLNELNQICSHFKFNTSASLADDMRANTFVKGGSGNLFIQTSNDIADNVNDFKAYLQNQYNNNTPVTFVANITPQTYQLTPTEVKTLLGINNIFADTGDVLNAEYTRDASIIINELIERVIALEQGA